MYYIYDTSKTNYKLNLRNCFVFLLSVNPSTWWIAKNSVFSIMYHNSHYNCILENSTKHVIIYFNPRIFIYFKRHLRFSKAIISSSRSCNVFSCGTKRSRLLTPQWSILSPGRLSSSSVCFCNSQPPGVAVWRSRRSVPCIQH